MKGLSEIKNSNIILDTNILINCGREEFGSSFKKILRTLHNNKNILSVSVISGFEIIKKFHDQKIIEYYLKLLNFLPNKQLHYKILNNAAIFASNVYKNRKEPKPYKDDNDIIIGATVVAEKEAYLLTCDRRDFLGGPLWKKIARECVQWESNDVVKIENIFLLEFNREAAKKKKLPKY